MLKSFCLMRFKCKQKKLGKTCICTCEPAMTQKATYFFLSFKMCVWISSGLKGSLCTDFFLLFSTQAVYVCLYAIYVLIYTQKHTKRQMKNETNVFRVRSDVKSGRKKRKTNNKLSCGSVCMLICIE